MKECDPHPPAATSLPLASPASGKRTAVLLGIGGSVGLILGVAITLGVLATTTFLSPTLPLPLPSGRDSVEVLHELNALRHEVNQLNVEKKLAVSGNDETVSQILQAVTAMSRGKDSEAKASSIQDTLSIARGAVLGATSIIPSTEKRGAEVVVPLTPGANAFADLDGEIKNLEKTQTILNTVLDLFLPAAQQP